MLFGVTFALRFGLSFGAPLLVLRCKISGVNVANDVRLSQRQQIVVAFQVLRWPTNCAKQD